MITRDEADGLRDELLEVLSEDAHNTKRLLSRLDSITRETGVGAYSALLLILTHLSFEENEAREHWRAILTHRHEISLAMARDVGVRVALVDYFMNVNQRLVQPTLIDLEMFEAREAMAGKDPLTGLADDRTFRTAVHNELRRAKRYGETVAVVVFDLDDFGDINQDLGKLVSDRVIRETAMLLNNKVRDIDLAARPGEDELALVLPETGRNGAMLVAERFRVEVESHFARREAAGRPLELTVSGGVACYPDDAVTPEALLERAAQALYHAKAVGKNTIRLYQPERRRFLRFELDPGRFEVEVLSPQAIGSGMPRNLSRSGIMFTSPEAIDVGDAIEVRLVDATPAAPATALRLRGSVVRLEEIPEPTGDEAGKGPLAADPGDRFEIGMAFDLDWAENPADVLTFLEKAHTARDD